MKDDELEKHITATYTNLRLGMALLALLFPFLLWFGGYWRVGAPLEGSMSAYYHAHDGAMRDVFVGVLVAIGAFLYLYKGFTNLENVALNLAGLFAIGIAMFPMEWDCGDACRKITEHGTCAGLFFLCIAYVCLFRASDTLTLLKDPARIRRYKRTYRFLGIMMVASPLIAMLLTIFFPSPTDSTVFFVEAIAVLTFATYWRVKSNEIAATDAERRAARGELHVAAHGATDVFKTTPMVIDSSAGKP